MANYVQYRNVNGISSAPDTVLNNYVSSFKDYIILRTGSNTSVAIIGDSVDDSHFKNSIVYNYNSDTRNITRSHEENTSVTVYQNYYVRGDTMGQPAVPQYSLESNLVLSVIALIFSGYCFCRLIFGVFKLIIRRFRR